MTISMIGLVITAGSFAVAILHYIWTRQHSQTNESNGSTSEVTTEKTTIEITRTKTKKSKG